MYQLYRISAENPMDVSKVEPLACSQETEELENLLVKNPHLLPGDQMAGDDAEPYRWMLIKQQMPVESASTGAEELALDLLFVDQFAWLTFVECKLRSNRESYRKIVGQMLEYVSSAQHYWTEEKLKKYINATKLEELVPSEQTVDAFCKLAIENLKAGRVRLVFLLDEAPNALRAIATFLNEQLKEVEVFVVELRHFLDGASKFVVPLVFGYSEEAMTRRQDPFGGVRGVDAFKAALRQTVEDERGRSACNALLAFCEQYRLHWGRGKTPSCSPVLPCTAPRSAFTFWHNGDVTLNLDYMPAAVAGQMRSALQTAKIPFKATQKFPGVRLHAWLPQSAEFMAALEALAKAGDPAQEGEESGTSV